MPVTEGARRVAVTGAGALTPLGASAAETWRAARAGTSGVGPLTRVDPDETPVALSSRIAGEVAAEPAAPEGVEDRGTGRYARLALAAARAALADAGLKQERPADPRRVGVSIGSGMGGFPAAESAVAADRVDPRFPLRFLPSLAAGYVSEFVGAEGPGHAPATACAAGTHAVCEAMREIRTGRADVMIAGGSEAALSPTGLRGFDAMRALSTHAGDPAAASRPFDADRDGFVMAEGAGVLVLEALDRALGRGADPVAELTGFGRTTDAHHPTEPPPDARGLRRCMRRALADAGRDPGEVDHVNAHGTSTPRGDAHEATAVRAVFEDPPPLTAPKSMTGHALGASGAIEALLGIRSIQDGVVPPTINYETPDPECDVPVVTGSREAPVDVVLSNSAGFGGANGTLLIERVADDG